jgi:hypothetical protein
MKQKIRSEITKLAKQLILEEASFDTSKLKLKIGELYEQLVVLDYLESEDDVTTSNKSEALDSKSFREENWFTEPEPLPQSKHKEELIEPSTEKIKDLVAQMPQESQQVDDLLEEVIPQSKYRKNDLEEFASNYHQTPTFERKEIKPTVDEADIAVTTNSANANNKVKSLNDTVNQGLNIGLNDRLAFVKHLFNDNNEDYTRVLSQISTMKTYDEVNTFIKARVKPDYNYWLKKDLYSERFMNIIEKSFN